MISKDRPKMDTKVPKMPPKMDITNSKLLGNLPKMPKMDTPF